MLTQKTARILLSKSIAIAVVFVVIAGLLLRSLSDNGDSREKFKKVPALSAPNDITAPQTVEAIEPPLSERVAESEVERFQIELPEYSEGCLPIEGAITDERLRLYQELLSESIPKGFEYSAYRKMETNDLRAFVMQSDSAAMYTLAARLLNESAWLEESQEEVATQMSEASELAYEAALRGRLFALFGYGRALTLQGIGPVSLGWIDQSTYDQLSDEDRRALRPDNIYGYLVFDILPELVILNDGRALLDRLNDTSDLQMEIRRMLKLRFEKDLLARDLASPVDRYRAQDPETQNTIGNYCAHPKLKS